jgi:hypothetical protein
LACYGAGAGLPCGDGRGEGEVGLLAVLGRKRGCVSFMGGGLAPVLVGWEGGREGEEWEGIKDKGGRDVRGCGSCGRLGRFGLLGCCSWR